jgi:hypothetical protein
MGHFHHFDSFFYEYPIGIPVIILGLLILTLGRKLFWLFVGAVGFVSGLHIAQYSFYGQPEWVVLLAGVFAGILGAVFAIFLQKMAVVFVGFFAGGYLTLNFINLWGWHSGQGFWFFSIIGGIIGAIIAAIYFDWALIIFSSLIGAAMISQSLSVSSTLKALIFALLMIIGIFTQSNLMPRDLSQSSKKKLKGKLEKIRKR